MGSPQNLFGGAYSGLAIAFDVNDAIDKLDDAFQTMLGNDNGDAEIVNKTV